MAGLLFSSLALAKTGRRPGLLDLCLSSFICVPISFPKKPRNPKFICVPISFPKKPRNLAEPTHSFFVCSPRSSLMRLGPPWAWSLAFGCMSLEASPRLQTCPNLQKRPCSFPKTSAPRAWPPVSPSLWVFNTAFCMVSKLLDGTFKRLKTFPAAFPMRVKTCKTLPAAPSCCYLPPMARPTKSSWPSQSPPGMAPVSLGLQHCLLYGFETVMAPSNVSKPSRQPSYTCQNLQNSPCSSFLLLPASDGKAHPVLRFRNCYGTFKRLKTFPAAFLYVSKPAKLSLQLLPAVTCLRWQGPPSLLGLRQARRAWPPVSLGLQHCLLCGFETAGWHLQCLKTFPTAFLYVSKPAKLSLQLLPSVTWLRWLLLVCVSMSLALSCSSPKSIAKKKGVGGTRALAHSIIIPSYRLLFGSAGKKLFPFFLILFWQALLAWEYGKWAT